MPHQCTNCGHTFPDGSKEMLSGCPDCGGNKFQFAPNPDSGGVDAGADGSDGPETPGATDSESSSEGVASRAADTVRGWVSSGSTDEPTGGATQSEPTAGTTDPTPSESAADTGSSASRRTESDSNGRRVADRNSTGADRDSTNADRDRDRKAATGRDDESGDDESFGEWPDTARRPEDRSDSSDGPVDDADNRSTARSTDGPTGPRADADDLRDRETATMADSEDSAQASARSEVVPADDLPSGSNAAESGDPITEVDPVDDGERERTPEHGRVVSEPSGEQPSIEELRAELNEQFESIKILRPGQYELNLMELYNRDEYIISLQEDGRYVIDVPESWHDDADE